MNELTGQTFKQYRILNLLGRGGMGTVYRATDLKLNRDVAMKVIHDEYAGKPTIIRRFIQEAQITAKFDHPGIVKVFDFDPKHSPPYIIMELIAGGNLRDLLDRRQAAGMRIPMSEAVRLLRQVCLALDYAHQHKVLHRDIKPGNLMIKKEPYEGLHYHVILTDLGLAKLLEGEPITHMDATGMGTPAYMSPEQARGAALDARSDVYSLGVLSYELVVGRLPFFIKDLAEANHYHNNVVPPPLSSSRSDIPLSLEEIILKALEKNPARRFPNAAELARALKDVESASAEVESTPTELEKAETLTKTYEQSLQGDRGPSIFMHFPELDDRRYDHIQVLLKMDETPYTVKIASDLFTIGRSSDNDIPLEDSKVSRNHARLSFDGENYQITDLNSANGTFLGNLRLSPEMPQVWKPEVPVRIGGVWLRLVRAQKTSEIISSTTGATSLAISRFHISPETGCVGILMEPEQLAVEPGRSVTATIWLLNQSSMVHHFSVMLSGIPQNWIAGPLPNVRLMPGEPREIILTLQPPRLPQSRAGRHAFTLRAVSQEDPAEAAELKATLTIAEYFQFHCDLQSQRIRAGQKTKVTVHNQGNLPETFNLQWNDRAEKLAFDPSHVQLQVIEGQSASAEFRATPRTMRWMGGEAVHPFTAQVGRRKGEAQSLNGEVISRARILGWTPPIVIFLCLLLLVSAVVILPPIFSRTPTPTMALSPTPGTTTLPPGAPSLEEWCVYLQNNPPPTFLNCPFQVRVDEGQAVMIRWKVRNVTEVELDPLGNQDPEGEIPYTVSVGKTITLRASNAAQSLKSSIELIVTHSTPITSTPTLILPTYTLTLTLVPPTLMPITPTRTLTPIPVPPTFTPIGGGAGKIAFSSNQNGNYEIYVMNSDGSGLVNLTNNSATDSSAGWSPDGRRIVFGSNRNGNPELYVMNADGSNPIRLTNNSISGGNPSWASDGKKIVFWAATGTDTYSEEIFVMNADGSGLIRLTENRTYDFDPSWSPDGTKIVFCSGRDGDTEIYVMNADGGGPMNLTNYSAPDYYPKWSPDGRKITFSSYRDGNYEIYVMNADGSGLMRLTQNSAVEHFASWSPDGRKIVFVSSRNDPNPSTCAEKCKYEIYVMNADGSNQTKLTNSAADLLFPIWSP